LVVPTSILEVIIVGIVVGDFVFVGGGRIDSRV
jgi:hypothetical protein